MNTGKAINLKNGQRVGTGQHARLFPNLAPSERENRTTSIFLAMIRAVPELFGLLFEPMGVRIGSRTKIFSYTQIHLNKTEKPKDARKGNRPDGLIIARSQSEWLALIESKIGKETLYKEQVERYLEDAKNNDIPNLVTISNEIAPQANIHPLRITPRSPKVSLHHISWRDILTTAILLKDRGIVESDEKIFLIDEFIRLLKDPAVGVSSFDQMPQSWPDLCKQIRTGAILGVSDDKIGDACDAFQQEISDMALLLTEHLGVPVRVGLTRKQATQKDAWRQDLLKSLTAEKKLIGILEIPDAAADIIVSMDLRSATYAMSMTLGLPRDKKTNKARLNWFLRQIKDSPDKDILINIIWASRSPTKQISLAECRNDLESLLENNSNAYRVSIILSRIAGSNFASRKKIIQAMEDDILYFYDHYGSKLKSWQATAPKPITRHNDVEDAIQEDETVQENQEGQGDGENGDDNNDNGNTQSDTKENIFSRKLKWLS